MPANKSAVPATSTVPATPVVPVSTKPDDSVVQGDVPGTEVSPVKDNAVSVIIEKVNNLLPILRKFKIFLKC